MASVVKQVEEQQEGAAEAGMAVLSAHRVAVFIVAYDAARHIESVLERIPADVASRLAEIFVIDDSSNDDTTLRAREAAERLGLANVRVMRTPSNQGYGGNQKIGYAYSIERGFDIVVMLHGDGQYPPEMIREMVAPFSDPAVSAVLGSRMINRRDALRGGMPLYKWVGNQILTWFENAMLNVRLAEFHTGYRAFRVATLEQLPFEYCSNDFQFDTEILIQLMSGQRGIVEIPIPTRYGDEVCHVNGFRYAWNCAKAVVRYRLFLLGIFYDPQLDFRLFDTETYRFKLAPNTLHQHVLAQPFAEGEAVLDLGAASGFLSKTLSKTGVRVVAVDSIAPAGAGDSEAIAFDLDQDFAAALGARRFDTAIALDVIEHLDEPEEAVKRIARVVKPGGRVLASTANVGFFITRMMLAMGVFNYGKRGILDLTHKRLFTIYSFERLFRRYGFRVRSIRGFGPPIRDMISYRWPWSWIDSTLSTLARWYPKLFAFNFLIEAERLPMLEEVARATVATAAGPLATERPHELSSPEVHPAAHDADSR